ncbi:MAG: N-acetyltransferase [Rhodococcus sp.]|nr:N-acetyltransferase [Rhodococcus sp. (in: high G+C Gram-positive bacteria)]
MIIRRETPADIAAIADVHRHAFDGDEPAEVSLVDTLRGHPSWIPELSLVAELGTTGSDSAAPNTAVVGHVCLTRAHLGDLPVLALGPIGVLPAQQGSGVGAALMHAALGGADAMNAPLVALLGHLDYYPRFGFVAADSIGIEPDETSWTSHFQVRPLATWRPDMTGTFRYADPFYAL